MLEAQLKELSLPRPSQEAGDILVLLRERSLRPDSVLAVIRVVTSGCRRTRDRQVFGFLFGHQPNLLFFYFTSGRLYLIIPIFCHFIRPLFYSLQENFVLLTPQH